MYIVSNNDDKSGDYFQRRHTYLYIQVVCLARLITRKQTYEDQHRSPVTSSLCWAECRHYLVFVCSSSNNSKQNEVLPLAMVLVEEGTEVDDIHNCQDSGTSMMWIPYLAIPHDGLKQLIQHVGSKIGCDLVHRCTGQEFWNPNKMLCPSSGVDSYGESLGSPFTSYRRKCKPSWTVAIPVYLGY